MTEHQPISRSDVEQLSAYLDGQLPGPATAALEARLADEPQLRRALDELQATVRMLSSLPAVVPPRDFRLTEQMLPRTSWLRRLLGAGGVGTRRTYPVMQLGTALAGLALVVVVGADLLLNQSVAGINLNREAASAVQLQPVGQLADQVGDEGQPVLQAELPSEGESAAEAESAGLAEQAEELDRAAVPIPAEDQVGTPAAEFAAANEPSPELAGTQSADAEAGAAAAESGAELAAGAVPAEGAQAGEELAPELPAAQGVDHPSNQPDQFRTAPGRLALTVLEVGLAAITLTLLILSLRPRRSI